MTSGITRMFMTWRQASLLAGGMRNIAMNEKPIVPGSLVLSRLSTSLSFAVVAAGAALSSRGLSGVLRVVRNAESSGLLPVARSVAESNLPILIALYVGIGCGVVAIALSVRASMQGFPPPPWLLLLGGALSLFPIAVVWQAESMMIRALSVSRVGVVPGASTIERLLSLALWAGLVSVVVLLVSSLFRLSMTPRRKWSFIAVFLSVEMIYVFAVIAFQTRNAWIHNLYSHL